MRTPTESAEIAAISGVLDRPRLSRVLDATMNRVCILEGPSGTGKTTLVRHWALQQDDGAPLVWIPLGSGIDSRRAFWEHVVTTARRVGALPGDAAQHALRLLGASADPVGIATGLLTEAGPVTLVLDAYEHLGDAIAEVDGDLIRLVTALPDVRLLVTTRGRTALTDLELSGIAITRVITIAELAFTADEVGSLLAGQSGIDDARVAESVRRSTRGYALTVRAAALALSRLGRIPNVGSIDWDAVMAARLEGQLPDAEAVRFVEDTSVAPYVDVELATRLTGHEDAEGMLDLLERNGFGRWIPYAQDRPVFQYVESIRDTFRARTARGGRLERACVVAAEWLRANDDIDQALLFAVEGRDYELADRIYVQVVTTKPDSYVTSRYLTVLRRVPEDVLPERPMLALGLGLALTANALLRSEAPRILRIAADSEARPAYVEPAVDAFFLAGMRTVARRLALSFQASADSALPSIDLVDEIDPALLPRLGDHLGMVVRQLSYSLLQGGRIDDALGAISRAVTLSTTQTARNYAIAYAAGTAAFAGDLVRARSHLASIDRDAWPEDLRKSYLTGLGLVAEAYLLLDAMDFEGVVDLLRDVDVYMPQAEFWPFHTAIAVAARQGAGSGRAEAERVMSALAADFPPPGVGDNVATDHLLAVLAHVLIAEGDPRAAGALLDGRSPDSPYLASARIALILSREAGGQAMTKARELVELPGHTLRTRAAAQTFAAAAALRQTQQDDAWLWLSSAAVAGEAHGPRSHVRLLPERDRVRLREFAASRGSLALQRHLDVPSRTVQENIRPAIALTPREGAVLSAFAEHGSVRQVAEALVVSPHTIKTQLQGIYRKLGVSSRQSALSVARELGLLEPAR
ncbi:helix-turn-helix transcriptional regulator [Microbacterium tumbae]